MKYWDFNVRNLIADFPKNQRTLTAIKQAVTVAKGYLQSPLEETARGETEAYIDLLELRQAEYEMYVSWVILGLRELPEIERNVLKWWLVDHHSDERILYETGIENERELQKIKNISLAKFHEIVMP